MRLVNFAFPGRTISALLTALLLAAAIPPAQAQPVTPQMRERAVVNCKANRGTNCASAEGLKEWIDAERPRPAGQHSPVMQQKLEAARKAQQGSQGPR